MGGPGCFFFVVAPFCSCPASLVSRKLFAVGPGCAKCFFFCCAPLGAATFRRGQSKKKNTQGVFFFCSGPGERQGKEKPRWAPARGQSKKKTPPRVFFLLRPWRKAREGEAPLEAGTGPEQKKNTTQGIFFCCGPGERHGKEKPRWAPARGQSKKCFFFCSGPVPAPNGASPSPAVPRAGAKKNTWVVFFFCSGPVPAPNGFSFPCLSPGPQQKKKYPGWCFFLLRPRADAHSLTAGLGGDASPSAGWCFFFAAAPPGPGWCFFFLLWPRPDAHSLTVGWGDFGKARVVFFFAAAPPGLFRQ